MKYILVETNNNTSLIGKKLLDELLKDVGLSFDDVIYINGRPTVRNYYISVSHKNKYVVAAISKQEISVDIELIKDFDENILTYFFTLDESNYIKNSKNKNKVFFELYTKKECILKIENKNILYLKEINTLKCLKNYSFLHKYINKNYILTFCYKK